MSQNVNTFSVIQQLTFHYCTTSGWF